MKSIQITIAPSGIQKRIIELHPHDFQEWVHELIPALNNRYN